MYDNKYLIPDWRSAEKKAIREGVGSGLLRIGDDERVVVLSADLAASVKIQSFADKYPERFFEVGVAEQNMAGVAAGLSFTGNIPFMASYAAFSPGRNWEQIRVSISLSGANVKIIGAHGGVSVGVNGPSHMATEDLALMRVLPKMAVLTPCDATECEAAIEAAYSHDGPVYIRTTRPDTPNFTKKQAFEIGKIYKYREGSTVTIAACGIQVWDALMVAEQLSKDGIEAEVLNVSTVKPLDKNTLLFSVEKTKKLVTIEDHQIEGGMGSALMECVGENYPVPVKRIGIDNRFGVSGNWEDVYKVVGLDQQSLYKTIKKFVLD
jgi:transketolase